MTNQRLTCEKCGRPLVNGFSYTVEGIQCSCGHYTEISRGHVDAEADVACVYQGKYKKRTPYKRERNVMWRGKYDI